MALTDDIIIRMTTDSEWAHHLEHLHRVSTLVTAAHDVESALQVIVDSACEITGAALGALGVPGEPGQPMAHFVTSGLSETMVMPGAHPPIGRGVLAMLLNEGKPVRIANVRQHPHFEGWPKAHPTLDSFLGVPIQSNGQTLGDLYLANKQNGEGFTKDDQQLVEMLASHAAVVLQTLHFHKQTQELAVLHEREVIARQLEDDVLQAMYGVGLLLNNLTLSDTERAARELDAIRETFDEAIERLRKNLLDLSGHL
jgi:GAF domain-containing protein